MRDTYGHINGKAGMRGAFEGIRPDVAKAGLRRILTELYRRAGYLIALTTAACSCLPSLDRHGQCVLNRKFFHRR